MAGGPARLTREETTMPFVNIKIAGPALPPERIIQLQRAVTSLMAGVMRKKGELTAVLVEQTPSSAWSIGGETVAVAAHLDVKVTEGTNSAVEKASFIADAHALLKDALGPDLPLATYIVVDEVPGNAWGYDGQTQAQRAGAIMGR